MASNSPGTVGLKPSIVPVILSGGSGSRLWPQSRQLYPKQLLPLVTENSMLQETMLRVSDPVRFAAPLIICNEDHRFIIAEQSRALGIAPNRIVLEPMGRNTAPAAAVAALLAAEEDPNALLLLLAADHQIGDVKRFLEAVDVAEESARLGALTTFGITPDAPETGYGYIKRGEPLSEGGQTVAGAFAVERFVEKPDAETAQKYLDDGGYAWNSGMFMFSAQKLIDEMAQHQPDVLKSCKDAIRNGKSDLDFLRLDKEAFEACPSISIDYGIMEKTDAAAVVPASIGWTDVGAWSALWEIGDKDENNNVTLGDVITQDTKNSYVRSGDDHLTALVGLDNVVVVVTDDVILVADKDKSQDIKAVVERLKAEGRKEAFSHTRVYRPWGYYQSLHNGDRFQVKRITVNPGEKLSMQKHYHRAEHWVVVNGTAMVTREGEEILLRENDSIYIPLGSVHRLENPGKVPLNLIEVQSGAYLGEDDIVRIEDTYGRAG